MRLASSSPLTGWSRLAMIVSRIAFLRLPRLTVLAHLLVRRQLERALERGAVVHGLAVGDDHVLERQLEVLAEDGAGAIDMARVPDAQLAVGRGQRIREDESFLLRQPDRCLVTPARVEE